MGYDFEKRATFEARIAQQFRVENNIVDN